VRLSSRVCQTSEQRILDFHLIISNCKIPTEEEEEEEERRNLHTRRRKPQRNADPRRRRVILVVVARRCSRKSSFFLSLSLTAFANKTHLSPKSKPESGREGGDGSRSRHDQCRCSCKRGRRDERASGKFKKRRRCGRFSSSSCCCCCSSSCEKKLLPMLEHFLPRKPVVPVETRTRKMVVQKMLPERDARRAQ
jgi:hypothetical protein